MKLSDKMLEIFGLTAVAIGIMIGSADAQVDTIPGDSHGGDVHTDSPLDGSIISTEISGGDIGHSADGSLMRPGIDAAYFDSQNIVAEPYMNEGSE